ncbi:MAG TPA: hypothetical protein PK867_07045 [Pirellulales bacterium]|nr:hypothetical protein [Pirellulales bacterium]
MVDKELVQEVDRIVHGYYHECPFPLQTWAQRIEHLGFFVDDDAETLVRRCAQVADAAEMVAVLTSGIGAMPYKYERWQGRAELCRQQLSSTADEAHRQHCEDRLLRCARLADALETIWAESQSLNDRQRKSEAACA